MQLLWQQDTAILHRLLLDPEFQARPTSKVQLVGESQPKLWANMQASKQRGPDPNRMCAGPHHLRLAQRSCRLLRRPALQPPLTHMCW